MATLIKALRFFLSSESVDNFLIALLFPLSYKSHAMIFINIKNLIHLLKSLPQYILSIIVHKSAVNKRFK